MKKILFILFFTTMVLASSSEPWWNDFFHYRKEIFSNTFFNYDITDYSLNFTINTKALIESGKLRQDCRDMVIIEKFDNKLVKLPIFINGCGKNDSTIYFKTKSLKANNKENFFLYYGNPEFINENLTKEEILNYYDNFLDGIIDNNLWRVEKDPNNEWTYANEENGMLSIGSNAPGDYTGGKIKLNSLKFFSPIEKIRTKYSIFCSASGPIYMSGTLIGSSSSIATFDLIGKNTSEMIDVANCTSGGSKGRSLVIDFIYNKSSEVIDIYINNIFNKSINVSGWGIPQIEASADSGSWNSQASASFTLEAVNHTEDRWEVSFDSETVQTSFETDSDIKYQDVLGKIWAYYNLWNSSPILDADCKISVWDGEIYINNSGMIFSKENQRYEFDYTPTKNQLYYYNISCSRENLLKHFKQGTFTTIPLPDFPNPNSDSNSSSEPDESQGVSLPPTPPSEESEENDGGVSYDFDTSQNTIEEKETNTALKIEVVNPKSDQELPQKYLQVEVKIEGDDPKCMIKLDDGFYDNMFTKNGKATYNFLELEEGAHNLFIKCLDGDESETETLSFSVLPKKLEKSESEKVTTASATNNNDRNWLYGLIAIIVTASFFAYKYRKKIKQKLTNHTFQSKAQKRMENQEFSSKPYHSSQSKLDFEYT